MEIQVNVSLTAETLNALKALVGGATVPVSTETAAPTPKKGRGKKARAEEPEESIEDMEETSVEDLDDEDASEEMEDADDMEEVEEDAEEMEDEEPAKIDQKQLAQLKKALNSYSAKNGKPKAVKILHKYAKVSQDVKAEDFAKIMKALKV